MHGANSDGLRRRITDIVAGILAQNGLSGPVEPEARLGDIGMTSMDMVGLMLKVEATFDIAIPQDEISAENFQSVAAIERLVARRLDAAGSLKAVA